ncbi:MAG: hypothetical protein ACI4RD_03650 [Kiritimatiellia bacterium]
MENPSSYKAIGDLAKCVSNLSDRLDAGSTTPEVLLSPKQPVFSLLKTLLPTIADDKSLERTDLLECAKLDQAMQGLFKKCKTLAGMALAKDISLSWSSIYAILKRDNRDEATDESITMLMTNITDRLSEFCDSCNAKKKSVRKSRMRSGLRGKKTKKMDDQLSDFKGWLLDNPTKDSDKSRTIGARANKYWNQNEGAMTKAAKESGEKRGYLNAKALAQAYRKTK